MMLGRVPMYDACSLDDVVAELESTTGEKVVISDIDNTLVPQGVPAEDFEMVVNAAIDRLETHPNVTRVVALTNGAERSVPRAMSRANKPWTSRRRLGLRESRDPVVVVGDQVLTDGLLAWRLRAPFLHLVLDRQRESTWQATMRRIGRIVSRALFQPIAASDLAPAEEPS